MKHPQNTPIQAQMRHLMVAAPLGVSRKLIVFPLTIIGLVLSTQAADPDFTLTIEQTRPVIILLGMGLAINAMWQIRKLVSAWMADRHKATWRSSLQAIGWVAFTAASIGLAMLILEIVKIPAFDWLSHDRAVEVVIPLLMGIQMAFAFSPEDEPNLETSLTYPRPISWILLERFACASVLFSGLGLVASVLAGGFSLEWLPSMIFFGGLGAYITLSSRVAAFSAMIVGLVWFMSLQFDSIFAPEAPPSLMPLNYLQPFLWGVHPHAQADLFSAGDFLLNRVVVTGLGIALLAQATRYLQDVESLLTNRKGNQ